MNTAIILMAKNPVQGKVKTRLVKDTSPEKATAVYLQLLEKTCTTMAKVKQVCPIIYHSPELLDNAPWVPEGFKHELQSSGDLGQRMYQALTNELKTHEKVIIIGSDCAVLEVQHLQQAINTLDIADVVLGPSEDGGYYLIGMKSMHPELFIDINWGNDTVFEDTMQKIESKRLSLYLLPWLYDIDHETDLLRWKKEAE